MLWRAGFAIVTLLVCLPTAPGAEIEGAVVIKRKLTKRTVTAAASAYRRGVAVELPIERDIDAIAYERARVVIYLEGALSSTPSTATIEQKNRRFVPDLVVVPVGSTVTFPNLDAIFHNVFSLSGPKIFDLGNYPKNQTRTVTFQKPGVVFVNCRLHPNMAASIVVSPNGWSTRAGAEGDFRFSGLAPGKYTVVAWHKPAGFFRQTVQLEGDRTHKVQFLIPFAETDRFEPVARN